MKKKENKPGCYKNEEYYDVDSCCDCQYCPDCTRSKMDNITQKLQEEVKNMMRGN